MSGGLSAPGGFFTDVDFDYEARIALGSTVSGIGDVGLVLATLDKITDGDPQSWFDAWTGVAADLAARGEQALGRGHLATASWALLTAAEHYAKALVFVDGLADQSVLLPTFRAVAFERRLVAAVADPGAVDVSAGWTVHLPKALLDLLDSGQKDAFNAAMAKTQASASPKAARTIAFRSRPYGRTDPFDLFTEVRRYQVRDVAAQVTTPLLILDPDDEQFFPGQPQQLYDLLPGEKQILGFTQAQGASFNCQPTGRQLTHTQMLDWLADHLPSQRV